MTVTVNEIEILEALDFTPEDACESITPTCGNKATWIFIKHCCDETFALCDGCLSKLKDFVEDPAAAPFVCFSCGARSLPPETFEWKRL